MDDGFVELVYQSLWGQLQEDYHISGVENAFAEGSKCSELYEEMLRAYERLCSRLGKTDEDADVEIIINSLLEIEEETSCLMYRYGAQFGADRGTK